MARRDEELVFKLRAEGQGEVDKLAKEIEGLAEEAGDAARPADDLIKSLRDLGQQRAAIDNLQRTGDALRKANTEFRAAQDRVRALAQQIRESGEPTAKLSRDYEKAQREVSRLSTAQDRARTAFREARSETDRLGISTKNLGESARGVDAAFDRQAQALRRVRDESRDAALRSRELADAKDNLRRTLSDSRAQLAAFGLSMGALGLALRKVSSEAREYGLALAEVSTLLDDTSGVDAMSESVRRLAVQFGSNATEQAKALYQIISAGAAEGAEATNLLTEANKLALAGVTDITTAADGLTSVLNAYGLEVSESGRVSDAFFSAVRAGKTTVDELAGSIGRVAPIAATAGVGIEELLSATAALTKGGVDTNQAMTQLQAVIAAVVKPTKEASDAAEKLGIDFSLAALRSKGLAGFLDEIGQASAGNDEQLSKLFGSVQGLNAVFALTGNQAVSFSETLDQVVNSAGATDEALRRIEQSDQQAFNRLAASAGELRLQLGELVNVALVPLVRALTVAIDSFNELPSAIQGGALAIGGSLAVYLVFGKTISGIALALRAVQLAAAPAAAGIATTGAAAGTAAIGTTALATAMKAIVALKFAIPVALGAAAIALISYAEAADAAATKTLIAAQDLELLRIQVAKTREDTVQFADTVALASDEIEKLGADQLELYKEAAEGALRFEQANVRMLEGIGATGRELDEARRKVKAYELSLQDVARRLEAIAVEQQSIFKLATESVEEYAARVNAIFGRIIESGGDVREQLADIFSQVDLTSTESLRGVALIFEEMRFQSAEAAQQIEETLGQRLRDLSTNELVVVRTRIKELFDEGAEGAEQFARALDNVSKIIAQRLGIDLEQVMTGFTTAGRDALEAFGQLEASLDQLGITGEARMLAFGQAVRTTLRQISTAAELQEFQKRLEGAFARGEISAKDYAEAIEQVRRQTQALAGTTDVAGNTMSSALNRARDAALSLKRTVQDTGDEVEKVEEKTRLAAGKLSEFLNAVADEFGNEFAKSLNDAARQISFIGLNSEQALQRAAELRDRNQELIAAERARLKANSDNAEEYRKQTEQAAKLRDESLAAGASMAEALRIAQQGTREIRTSIELQQAAQRAPDRTFTVEIRVNGDVSGTQEVIDEITRRVIDRIQADQRLTQ